MGWEPNLGHVSAERPKKTHSLTNKTCSSEMDIFTCIAPRRTTARWLFNGKQGRGVGRITNRSIQNFSANVCILGVELMPRSWARTQINKPENIPMYFQSISNNTLHFNDAYSDTQKGFLFFQMLPN